MAAIHHQHLGTATLDLERRPPEHFRKLSSRLGQEGRQCLLVCEGPDGVIGWGIVKRYSDRAGYDLAAETSVFLDLEQRGRGHGSRMKRLLIQRCRDFGYRHVVARILAENEVSIRYNEQLGYRRVGIQHGIGLVNGERKDICILELLLDDPPSTP